MPDEFALPDDLIRNLADSVVEVLSWDGISGRLVLRITKEIGPEVGRLTFSGVSHVNLPPRLTIIGLGCGGLERLPAGYLDAYHPGDRSLDEGETVFVLDGSWFEIYFVVAETATYSYEVP